MEFTSDHRVISASWTLERTLLLRILGKFGANCRWSATFICCEDSRNSWRSLNSSCRQSKILRCDSSSLRFPYDCCTMRPQLITSANWFLWVVPVHMGMCKLIIPENNRKWARRTLTQKRRPCWVDHNIWPRSDFSSILWLNRYFQSSKWISSTIKTLKEKLRLHLSQFQ